MEGKILPDKDVSEVRTVAFSDGETELLIKHGDEVIQITNAREFVDFVKEFVDFVK